MLAPPSVGAAPGDGRRSARRRGTAAVLVAATVFAGVLGVRWVVDELRGPTCELRAPTGTQELTPEQTANAATIAMVGLDRGLGQRAVTIALATAIQESKLRNLNYGDADSLGLFQQRPSQGWGTPDEVRDPVHASRAFYDALVQVPGWEEGEVTVVAQAVQRSAFPEAYADHEEEGRTLSAALTGEQPGAVGCRLDPPDSAGSARALLEKAERQFSATGAAEGSVVRLEAPDRATAWATATWAVAHAEAESIVSVAVAGQTWSREAGDVGWTEAEVNSGSAADDSADAGGADAVVTITLAD